MDAANASSQSLELTSWIAGECGPGRATAVFFGMSRDGIVREKLWRAAFSFCQKSAPAKTILVNVFLSQSSVGILIVLSAISTNRSIGIAWAFDDNDQVCIVDRLGNLNSTINR